MIRRRKNPDELKQEIGASGGSTAWADITGKPAAVTSLSGTNTGDNATNSQYSGLATSKQDTLVSGTNIKTINGSSILGSGDLTVSGSGLAQYQVRRMIRR